MPKDTHAGSKGKSLTLTFDAPVVSPDVFRRAINAFIEMLKAVSDEAAGTGKKIQWTMSVAKGSTAVIARPLADVATKRAAAIVIQTLPEGIRRLEKGATTAPSYFNERALHAAKELGEITEIGSKSLDYVRIRSTGKASVVSERTVTSIDRLLKGQHQALGAVEGKLQTLTERGTLQFVVYDSLYDKGVNCFMGDNIVQDAIAAFRRRVAVSGMVQYDKEGRPVSIRVDAIRVFKDISDLPPIHSLRGIFRRQQ